MTSHNQVEVYRGNLPDPIRDVIDDMLPEQLVRVALVAKWSDALAKGGIPAIAGALVICKSNRLDPLRDHVYVMETRQGWRTMISAHGYAAIAARLADRKGSPLLRGMDFSEPVIDEEAGTVTVRCRIYRGPERDAFEGKGTKPLRFRKRDGTTIEDPYAELKARTMAARHAFQWAFPGDMPLERLVDEEDEIIDAPAAAAREAAPQSIPGAGSPTDADPSPPVVDADVAPEDAPSVPPKEPDTSPVDPPADVSTDDPDRHAVEQLQQALGAELTAQPDEGPGDRPEESLSDDVSPPPAPPSGEAGAVRKELVEKILADAAIALPKEVVRRQQLMGEIRRRGIDNVDTVELGLAMLDTWNLRDLSTRLDLAAKGKQAQERAS